MTIKLCRPRTQALAVILLLTATGFAQVKPRIAVLDFDDRTNSKKDINIGAKVADGLIAELTNTGAYTVLDRQYIEKLLAEKNRKHDENYDSSAGARTGLMGTADIMIAGQIDSFNANVEQTTKGHYVSKTVESDGKVTLKVTARLISVELGSMVTAPSASSEQKAVFEKKQNFSQGLSNYMPGKLDTSNLEQGQSAGNTDQALLKLVDTAVEDVAKQLAAAMAKSAASMPVEAKAPAVETAKKQTAASPSVTDRLPVKTEVVGMSDGLAYIDAGSSAGVKVGDKFAIKRASDTGLKDKSGNPVMHHKVVCTLVVSTLEDGSAAGKCSAAQASRGPDSIPRKGDEVEPVAN